jgi:nucleotidyltransferase substrate binding protein (TIGR01987 family)
MEKIPRAELQFDNFKRAFARLKEALAENESDFIRDSIIQRFEFTFEMAWKTMFRYLADKGDDVLPKAWSVLPVAFEVKLIDDADTWEQLRKFRNDLSHEYNENKAIELAAFVRTKGHDAFEKFAAVMTARL